MNTEIMIEKFVRNTTHGYSRWKKLTGKKLRKKYNITGIPKDMDSRLFYFRNSDYYKELVWINPNSRKLIYNHWYNETPNIYNSTPVSDKYLIDKENFKQSYIDSLYHNHDQLRSNDFHKNKTWQVIEGKELSNTYEIPLLEEENNRYYLLCDGTFYKHIVWSQDDLFFISSDPYTPTLSDKKEISKPEMIKRGILEQQISTILSPITT